ncbi:hypothetical protein BDV32DRAFT_131593 [Aspergillus pseudonomiae]|nr:hypothetical protein BDV32DRAFT_131593 [Aspergillus pseudonomiae]
MDAETAPVQETYLRQSRGFPYGQNDMSLKPVIYPFAGRIGGNQGLVLDRNDPANAELLKKSA